MPQLMTLSHVLLDTILFTQTPYPRLRLYRTRMSPDSLSLNKKNWWPTCHTQSIHKVGHHFSGRASVVMCLIRAN